MEKWTLQDDGWYAPPKRADEALDYVIDWSKELASDKARGWQTGDDTISAIVTFTVSTGITKGATAISADGRQTAFRLSGGTAGQTYDLFMQIRRAVSGELVDFPPPGMVGKIEVK